MMEEDSENGGENLTYYEEVDLKKENVSKSNWGLSRYYMFIKKCKNII